jgi:hypothetical protein
VENVIEVRYAGVVVGRSTKVRDWNEAGAFIGFAEPLPSGTPLVLKGDGVEQPARVVEVIESAEPGAAGMRVTFADVARAARTAPKPTSAPTKSVPSAAPAPSPAPTAAAPAPTAPPVAAAPAVASPAAAAPVSMVAEAAPVEVLGGTSSAVVTGEASGPATGEHHEGEAGQGGGKRRRRRR